MALGLGGALIGVKVHFRGRQLRAKAEAEAVRETFDASRPHILYLRMFQSDLYSTGSFATDEEQLRFVLQPFGMLLAIGKPGEQFPTPGGARMYAPEGKWRKIVVSRMRSARLTIIRAGLSDGLDWEVERAFSVVSPENLLILILRLPTHEYRRFADLVRERCAIALPSLAQAGMWRQVFCGGAPRMSDAMPGFICFDSSWVATFLPLPCYIGQTSLNDMRKPFNIALRSIFERHGVTWHRVGRFS